MPAPTYAADIKPLFRPKDRNSMLSQFDLWKYDDVRQRAAAIHKQLADGSMPCDGAWSQANVTLFKSWMDAGMPA